MKSARLLCTLGLTAMSANAAVIFNVNDFATTAFGDNKTSIELTKADGLTNVKVTVATTTGVVVTNKSGSGFSSHLGVVNSSAGPTLAQDFNTSNAAQASRIGNGQTLTLTFDTDVIFNSFTHNNWLLASTETVLVATTGTAFNSLTGYDTVNGTGQDTKLTSFGYSGSAFTMTTNNADGSNVFTTLFGGDEGTDILLKAGDSIIFGAGNTGAGTPGWGLNQFTVTAVPEPSSAAFLGLVGLGLLVRRRH